MVIFSVLQKLPYSRSTCIRKFKVSVWDKDSVSCLGQPYLPLKSSWSKPCSYKKVNALRLWSWESQVQVLAVLLPNGGTQVSPFTFLGLSFLLCSLETRIPSKTPSSCHSKASCASLLADSTNVVFTITMLLGNLSSCCNPWIYMGFNSHLWPHTLRHLACCGGPQPRMRRQLSNGSFSSRRTTLLLTRSSCPPTHSLSPSLSGRPGPEESPKDSEWVDREGVTEAGIF